MYKTPSHPTSTDKEPTAMAPGKASSPQAAGTRSDCVDSTELLRGQKTVEINHNGATYRLQATRLGKLILTK
ncbi:MAG: hemin uptake protein HemP [Polaromonas sp.]|nr:hemin uptake protein HemP [Polaromonas sp.]